MNTSQAILRLIGLVLCWLSLVAEVAPATTVIFQAESAAGREAARHCHEIWQREGDGLASALAGETRDGIGQPDTVLCLILDAVDFHGRFGDRLPDWGVGVALPGGRLVALNYSRIPAVGRGLREVFLHEMVHALLFQASGEVWLPTWLHEGTAMYHSGEWRFADTVSLVLDGHLPDLARLQGRFPAAAVRADRAYRTSLLAVRRLRDRHGPEVVGAIAAESRRCGEFHMAFQTVTGESVEAFSREFAARMRLRFGWLVTLTRWPTLFVVLGLVLAVGGVRRLLVNRRRLAALDEDGPA